MVNLLPVDVNPLPSPLCSTGVTPLYMSGILLQSIRQHFADVQNIMDPALREDVWSPNNDTNIVIEDALTWRPATEFKRPAILIKRNDWQSSQIAIDNRLMGSDLLDNAERYGVQMTGSHTLFVIAGESAELDALAWEVYRGLCTFMSAIRENLGLLRLSLPTIGTTIELEEFTENYAVPITVAYAFQVSWTTRSAAPLLQSLGFEFSAENP